MSDDFTLHFDIPPAALPDTVSPSELERAFAVQQIHILLEFVTLYENGQPVRPDSFSIVNAPDVVHLLGAASEQLDA